MCIRDRLSIDDQIKNQTKLSYISGTANESLPSSYNGLGSKNLIKMEFLLAAFAKDIEKRGVACVPLLFIEEPELSLIHIFQKAQSFLEKHTNLRPFLPLEELRAGSEQRLDHTDTVFSGTASGGGNLPL